VLTRDHVVAEALAITSATDAAALSMRTLATRLGVVPAALDRHVRSKEQLYDVILDGALAGVDCQADPAPGPGRSPRSRLAFRLIYNHAIGFARSSRSPGNPGQALAVLDDHLATLSGSPTPTSSTPGTPVSGMAMRQQQHYPASGAMSRKPPNGRTRMHADRPDLHA